MKGNRIIRALAALFLAACLTDAMPVMAGTEVSTVSPVSIRKGTALNVLFIGNSFSEDTSSYLYDIVEQTGYKICVGDAWIGGSRLCDHVSNASSDAEAYTYVENASGSWSSENDNGNAVWRLSRVMDRRKWDVIILQSLSTDVGRMESFYPGGDEEETCYLEQLAGYCRKKCPGAHIAYNMTWALPEGSDAEGFAEYGGQMEMCRAAWTTTERLMQDLKEKAAEEDLNESGGTAVTDILEAAGLMGGTGTAGAASVEFVIPTGTAIQNARSSYLGDTLHRDNKHLNYGLGRCIASMTAAMCLGYPIDEITSLDLSETASSLHLPVIRSSVRDAVEKPFSLSEQSREKPVLSQMKAAAKTRDMKVTVSWDRVEGASAYKLEYKLPGRGPYTAVTVDAARTSYQFTGGKGTSQIRIYALGDRYISRTDDCRISVKIQ